MAITVNRSGSGQRPLFTPHELEHGKSYRRSDAVNNGANYRDVIVVAQVDRSGEKFLLDLKDFRTSPPDHESLRGIRFYETDITIDV